MGKQVPHSWLAVSLAGAHLFRQGSDYNPGLLHCLASIQCAFQAGSHLSRVFLSKAWSYSHRNLQSGTRGSLLRRAEPAWTLHSPRKMDVFREAGVPSSVPAAATRKLQSTPYAEPRFFHFLSISFIHLLVSVTWKGTTLTTVRCSMKIAQMQARTFSEQKAVRRSETYPRCQVKITLISKSLRQVPGSWYIGRLR